MRLHGTRRNLPFNANCMFTDRALPYSLLRSLVVHYLLCRYSDVYVGSYLQGKKHYLCI